MSGPRPFVRQLGYQPGVQLNPLADNTDGVVPDNSDQVFATIARLSRGRIDRPFEVNRSNFLDRLGSPESLRVNALNEPKLQIYEGLNNGAYQAVVQRIVPAAAAKYYAVADLSAAAATFGVSATAPTGTWSLAVMDHACHNDGIVIAVHAEATPLGGAPTANKTVVLRVFDSDGVLRFEFEGSVDPAAKDDFGASLYLPDVVSVRTDEIEVTISAALTASGIDPSSDAYGRDSDNRDQWATSAVLTCFNESGTTYTATDFDRCIKALRDTRLPFGYLITGGTQAPLLMSKIIALGIEINMPTKVDLDGRLSPSAAITQAQNLNVDSHYAHFYWAPLEADDPINGGKAVWGTGGLNVGLSCARNARINGKGFAPKNRPISGADYSVNRSGIRQIYSPSEQELSDLARAQINPVIYDTFSGGGRYVWLDCLTAAKTRVSYKKLIPVAEMSASLDNLVSTYAKELLMLPMTEFVKRMSKFMETTLDNAQSSGWLVPAKNLPGGAAYAFEVKPSEVRPADLVHINYATSYDGVARQVIVQQTLTR